MLVTVFSEFAVLIDTNFEPLIPKEEKSTLVSEFFMQLLSFLFWFM